MSQFICSYSLSDELFGLFVGHASKFLTPDGGRNKLCRQISRVFDVFTVHGRTCSYTIRYVR